MTRSSKRLDSPTNPLVISTYYKILGRLARNQHILIHTNESLTPEDKNKPTKCTN